jgi:hypothetical protein
MLEWVSEFFCIFWIINICTWIESFILNVVKSIIHELHFALTTMFWNECIKIWHISHLYLNGLVIKSKCSCMQSLRCMKIFKLLFFHILNSCTLIKLISVIHLGKACVLLFTKKLNNNELWMNQLKVGGLS